MRAKLNRFDNDQGFTLIELLVVILIIGILAAIAIPSFLNQKGKANDAGAKELARTAQTAIETYATDHDGSYSGVTVPSDLQSIEPSIAISAASGNAYLSAVTGTASGYTIVTAAQGTGDKFTIINTASTVSRSCTGGSAGGCTAGTW